MSKFKLFFFFLHLPVRVNMPAFHYQERKCQDGVIGGRLDMISHTGGPAGELLLLTLVSWWVVPALS